MATIRLLQDFKDFLKLLNEHKVRYLLIGGYAVGYHGYPRATADHGYPAGAVGNRHFDFRCGAGEKSCRSALYGEFGLAVRVSLKNSQEISANSILWFWAPVRGVGSRRTVWLGILWPAPLSRHH